MITYKVHLIRTGKTGYGPRERYVGQTDLPLSDFGRQELLKLRRARLYPKVETVYSSPLSRCMETADILFPDRYTVAVDGLADMNLGDFEGRTFGELRSDPDFSRWIADSRTNAPPGGEETAEFAKRTVLALSDIFHEMMDSRLTSVAVVTHCGVIMSVLSAIGLPRLPLEQWAVENGAGYTLLLTPQMWMRDNAVEVFANLPMERTEQNLELYGDPREFDEDAR